MFNAENYSTEQLRDANPIVAMLAMEAAREAHAGNVRRAQEIIKGVYSNHEEDCGKAAEVLFARYYAAMELRRIQASC